jgi:4-amino-4-deoxy-L-arabinose transferase-like glycosyltransferase
VKAGRGGKTPWWAWLGLLAILALDVWLRGHTFAPLVRERWGVEPYPAVGAEGEPLDCDEAAYGYIGRRMVNGAVLYRDLTENKPPLGYAFYATAVAIGGPTEWAIRVLPIPIVLATIVLLGWIANELAGPVAAVAAAFAYAIASTDPRLYGNAAQIEHPLNLFAVASLAAMVRAWTRPGRSWPFVAGLCVGAAALVKQGAALNVVVYGVALVARRPRRWRDMAALLGGFALAWIVAIGVLVVQGAGRAAFEDIVRLGAALAAETPSPAHAPSPWFRWLTGNSDPRGGSLPFPFGKTDWLVWWGGGTWPLWLASVAGLFRLAAGPGPRRLACAWTLSAWVQLVAPGLYWPHYYLIPLPGAALAVAVLLEDEWPTRRGRWGRIRWWMAGVALLSLAATAFLLARDYLGVPPARLGTLYKGGQQWLQQRALGRELGRRSRAWRSPRLFVWGYQSPLYFYSGLDAPTPEFFANDLLKGYADRDHPLIRPRIRRIMDDLRARPPELIFVGYPPFADLRTFLRERYEPDTGLVRAWPDGIGLWVKRGEALRFDGRAAAVARGAGGD